VTRVGSDSMINFYCECAFIANRWYCKEHICLRRHAEQSRKSEEKDEFGGLAENS
jgi:hypothetical protein